MNDFIRVRRGPDTIEIATLVVTWNSQTPVSDWPVIRRLPGTASEGDVAKAVQAILDDRRYFSTCAECGARLPRGMTSTYERFRQKTPLCHGCAENQGVVF